jgi:8-oxo-dGTP diphosphatase
MLQTLVHISVAITNGQDLLLVQEMKPENHGKWNLPGGHLEFGELVSAGAVREVLEETGLKVQLEGMLGIYQRIATGSHSIRFVFAAKFPMEQTATAGDQIMAIRYAKLDEVLGMDDELLVSPVVLKQIVRDIKAGRNASWDALWPGNNANL